MKIFSSSRKKNRKGSLQLSINAIVVLVMAMVVLGLGLGFIRTLINKGQDKFVNVMSGIDIKNKATSSEPVTVLPELSLKRGSSTSIEVGYYNNNALCAKASPAVRYSSSGTFDGLAVSTGSGVKAGSLLCVDSKGTGFTDGSFSVVAQPIEVQAGSETGFLAQLIDGCASPPTGTSPASCKGEQKLPSGDYVCTITIGETPCGTATTPKQLGPSKQVIVHVSN